MEKSALAGIIDVKIEKILRMFFNNKEQLFHINKISKDTKVPVATTFRIIKKLVKLDLISYITIGKFKVYKLNLNSKSRLLLKLLK
ncbi:MAG: hypothetical protein ABIC04_04725 [Nanoarchaeota archaeon]